MNQRILYYLLIIILLNQTLAQAYDEIIKDSTSCTSHQDRNTCSSVKLSSGIYQCCRVDTTTFIYGEHSASMCSIQIKPIKILQEELEKETTKALYKEMWGYIFYSHGPSTISIMKALLNYDCIDGKATVKFGFDTYTNEEIKILQSENHCMSYFYGFNEFTSKEECFNSVLLPSSEKLGLTCGYFEFNIKYSDGTSENIKSCNIFNKDVITSARLDDKSKESFESFVHSNQDDGKIVLSYQVAFSDDEGNNVVYDSLTQRINLKNSQKIISTVKYLIFISLLLIL